MNPVHMVGAFGCLSLLSVAAAGASTASSPRAFDIAPFALPNCPNGEVRFEEPRDIVRVEVTFAGPAPSQVGLSILHRLWPETRIESAYRGVDNAMSMGWFPIEDWFNGEWRRVKVQTARGGPRRVVFTFPGLTAEFPDMRDYDVTFRRTQGLRVEAGGARVRTVRVFTASRRVRSSIRVQLDAGAPTKATRFDVSGYNAVVRSIRALDGGRASVSAIELTAGSGRAFTVDLDHMIPSHRFCHDEGHVTFAYGDDAFTISLASLEAEGPIWYADEGIFITRADDPTTFEQYRARIAGRRTISQQVKLAPEQSLGGAMNGQPRPHADSYVLGCKNARQRFRIEPNGDVHLAKMAMDWVPMRDTPHYRNGGDARFLFGLERWRVAGRYPDPAPIVAYNLHLLSDDITVHQRSFAVPLTRPIADDRLVADDTIIGVVQFTFTNTSDHVAVAELPVAYSSSSGRSEDRLGDGSRPNPAVSGDRVPLGPRDPMRLETVASEPPMSVLTSEWQGARVMRCAVDTDMSASVTPDGVTFRREIPPGGTCTLTLKIPYIELTAPNDLRALAALDAGAAYASVAAFWRGIGSLGAQVHTPEPRINALYRSHFAQVSVADMAMPGNPDLINTSVGTSIYPNYTNESCMIVQELEERGLHEEARRRLATWLKFQGTAALLGNFSDHDGVFFGAGGFECGNTYDQHHGWALWRMAEHYALTRDDAWLRANAAALVKGADWVFRQRQLTMGALPQSRGWERGFLPAGSLEDVSDYFYWLSTNAVTWRGVDSVARCLESVGHPEAARIRKEADAYRADLVRGFETSRQHAPLVRLADGRWVPTYPSRLYLRGRDTGWIREVLEGSVYLLISGLFAPDSRQAGWILDDYQDNRYLGADFGYPVYNREGLWFDVGGFSCQPNLLAGLMPYLDRDEPEIYIWMFFNAWAACFREEANSMVEHPSPILGHSNGAIVKTSDQSNAMKWLTYMYVYAPEGGLYLGRALPREWLSDGRDIWARGLSTRFGDVSVHYRSNARSGSIVMEAELPSARRPARTIARFRHPDKAPIRSVTVNGAPFTAFNASSGDVDLSGLSGKVTVEARY